ncbi:MAG: hypothetical protein WKH64_07645 [Chloroflexia bacterium]
MMASDRSDSWEMLFEEVRREEGVRALGRVLFVSREELDAGRMPGLRELREAVKTPLTYHVGLVAPAKQGDFPTEGVVPTLVSRGPANSPQLGPDALEFLALIGRHIWLTPREVATALGWRLKRAQDARYDLLRAGYIRDLDPDETVYGRREASDDGPALTAYEGVGRVRRASRSAGRESDAGERSSHLVAPGTLGKTLRTCRPDGAVGGARRVRGTGGSAGASVREARAQGGRSQGRRASVRHGGRRRRGAGSLRSTARPDGPSDSHSRSQRPGIGVLRGGCGRRRPGRPGSSRRLVLHKGRLARSFHPDGLVRIEWRVG